MQEASNKRTVQGEVERALAAAFGSYTARCQAASRTDTGVHARGQCIHFDGPSSWSLCTDRLNDVVNSALPRDILVWNTSVAPSKGTVEGLPWNANIAPTSKIYSYRWREGDFLDPLERQGRALWYKYPLDKAAIASCLNSFVGLHDFASFGNRLAHKQAMSVGPLDTTRTIYSIDLVDEGSGDFRLDFELDGALYKMVRNIVGALFAVGEGGYDSSSIETIMSRRDRTQNPTMAAPAEGLTLEHVLYADF